MRLKISLFFFYFFWDYSATHQYKWHVLLLWHLPTRMEYSNKSFHDLFSFIVLCKPNINNAKNLWIPQHFALMHSSKSTLAEECGNVWTALECLTGIQDSSWFFARSLKIMISNDKQLHKPWKTNHLMVLRIMKLHKILQTNTTKMCLLW